MARSIGPPATRLDRPEVMGLRRVVATRNDGSIIPIRRSYFDFDPTLRRHPFLASFTLTSFPRKRE